MKILTTILLLLTTQLAANTFECTLYSKTSKYNYEILATQHKQTFTQHNNRVNNHQLSHTDNTPITVYTSPASTIMVFSNFKEGVKIVENGTIYAYVNCTS